MQLYKKFVCLDFSYPLRFADTVLLAVNHKLSSPIRYTQSMSSTIIDNAEALAGFIAKLDNLPRKPPSLYVDLEGANLSRNGSVYILQIYLSTENHTYLVDICTLGKTAFSTPCSTKQTLKSIFEDPAIPKVLFDVRNDADALYAHFGVELSCVHDLQVMEVATRPRHRRGIVNGLGKCIEYDAGMTYAQRSLWKSTKDKGVMLFAPERGGSYEVFRKRPLSEEIKAYCIQDVVWLPVLYTRYRTALSEAQWREVLGFSEDRAAFSRLPGYKPHGRHKALSPWSSESDEHRTRITMSRSKMQTAPAGLASDRSSIASAPRILEPFQDMLEKLKLSDGSESASTASSSKENQK
jgi:exonuclease 3'-5' domain-containing protein 1